VNCVTYGFHSAPSGTRLAYSRTGFALTGIEWSGALNARLDASVDRHGKPIQLGVTAGGAAPVTVPLAYDYQRDPLGRITAQTEQVDGTERQHAYAYDNAGRLTQHTEDGQPTTWSYDANGNRTHENGAAIASYDSEDRLQAWKGSTYSYTPAGELAQKTSPAGTTRYQYDSLGNLRSVTLPNGNTITYLIDPQNRRIGKQKNGSLEYGLIYQDQLRPIAQTQPNGTIRSIFLYGETHAPEGMLRDGKAYRLIGDHLGSVRMVIDADTGDVAQRMDYDAWGRVTHDSNPGFQPFGYAGGIYDPDTGLTRFGARDYDAEVGRWTAKDPILFEGGDWNLYGYVLQDPVNFFDPDGLAPGDKKFGINDAGFWQWWEQNKTGYGPFDPSHEGFNPQKPFDLPNRETAKIMQQEYEQCKTRDSGRGGKQKGGRPSVNEMLRGGGRGGGRGGSEE